MGLNNKQQVFISEYLTCWNATEAARRAGYKHPNKQGPALLVNLGISEEIKRRLTERAMSAEEVLERLAQQARGEHTRYLNADSVDMPRLLRDGKAHLVKGIKKTRYGTDIEFYDAQAALQLLGRHHKLFTDMAEVTNTHEFGDSAERILRRMDSIATKRTTSGDPE